MVRGALVFMQGVPIGTLYKLQGSTVTDGCNSFVVPESGAENLVVSVITQVVPCFLKGIWPR